jgi:hypothetical protein
VNRRLAYATLALVSAVPRLVVLLHERGAIISGLREKSYVFAQVFVQNGTYGLIPGEPSAYTQPLYGWFLIPVWWLFGGGWLPIGLTQIAPRGRHRLARVRDGRRVVSPRGRPDRCCSHHVEPLSRLARRPHQSRDRRPGVRGGSVLLTLVVAERPSKRLAALLGVVCGLAILGTPGSC